MDPFHARLARIGLGAAAGYGFVLAGGYAVQAHGFLERLSDDVDLFTDIADPVAFSEAVDAVAAAYRAADLTVEVEKSGGVFARFEVPSGSAPVSARRRRLPGVQRQCYELVP
jgi:hypothetical protein